MDPRRATPGRATRVLRALGARAERAGPGLVTTASLLLLGILAMVDYVLDRTMGADLAFSIFYVLPVAATAWYAGRTAAWTTAGVAALFWLAADAGARAGSLPVGVMVWNTAVRLAFFVVIARLLVEIRERLTHEKSLAVSDPLTGLDNSRAYLEAVEAEVARARRYRHPFSVAYLDLDDFKAVNDRWGHGTGDRVLQEVATCLRRNTREADVVARMGGDEFGLLLPETDGPGARAVVDHVRKKVMAAIAAGGWDVGLSVGVVTFRGAPPTVDEAVRVADDLMYEAKREGRSTVRHLVTEGGRTEGASRSGASRATPPRSFRP